jgi:hypothetical protein
MSLRPKHLKIVGAAGAAALTIGGLASPAFAAGTASIDYTCSTQFGPAHASAVYNAATAPATMAVGQPLATTGTFTLDAGTTTLAVNALGWSKVKGTASSKPTASKAGLSLSFPKTDLGGGPGGSTVANAKGGILAGSTVQDSFTFVLGNLGHVVLTGYNASGKKKLGSVRFPSDTNGPCLNDDTTTTLRDGADAVTTQTVKDKSKTKESASYAAKKKSAISKAKVTARYGTKVTGKVKFTLKKGTHKVKTMTDKVNKKGIAKVVFKGVKKKGKYSISAKYTGSSTLKGSSGKDSFKV